MSADTVRLNETRSRKLLTAREVGEADFIQTIWDFKGRFRVTPLFYGYYSRTEWRGQGVSYQVPLAYLLVNLFILGYSFFAILRKMADNARQSKLASGKTEQYVFCWKLFTGWDYTIGNPESAGNTVMASANKFREAIAEYRVKLRQKFVCLRFLLRIIANAVIIAMIVGSGYVIYLVVNRSIDIDRDPHASGFRKNEVPIVVSFITLIFPNLFELVGKIERWHPRTSLRIQLGRVLALYSLNYYTLIFALFNKMEYYQEKAALVDQINRTGADLTLLSATSSVPDTMFRLGRDLSMEELESVARLATKAPPLSNLELRYGKNLPNQERPKLEPRLVRARRHAQVRVPQPPTLVNTPSDSDVSSESATEGTNSREPRMTGVGVTVPLPEGDTYNVTVERVKLRQGVSPKELNASKPLEFIPIVTRGYGSASPSRRYGYKTTHANPNSTKPVTPIPHSTSSPKRQPPVMRKPNYGQSGIRVGGLSSEDLQNLCWETMVGQEICKLIMTDLVMNIASILVVDFFRAIWVRSCNEWWCWNLETQFPEYGEFKVAENVLHVINNQGMIWLGLFFAPLLPALNNVKLIVLLYIRAWAVMTCNIPATQIFRASRSSNFYLGLLLVMLFLCTLPVGYVVASRAPSKTCGPFAGRERFYSIVTDKMKQALPPEVVAKLEYVASPGVVIPILVLLILVIYFLVSLIRGMKAANTDLQQQLTHERTEEKRKIYLLAGGGKTSVVSGPQIPQSQSLPDTTVKDMSFLPQEEKARREPWRNRLPLIRSRENLPNLEETDEEVAVPLLSRSQVNSEQKQSSLRPPTKSHGRPESPRVTINTHPSYIHQHHTPPPRFRDGGEGTEETADAIETADEEEAQQKRLVIRPFFNLFGKKKNKKKQNKDEDLVIANMTETTDLDPTTSEVRKYFLVSMSHLSLPAAQRLTKRSKRF